MAIRHEQKTSQRQKMAVQVITPVQHRILVAVGQFHFVTHELIGWLLGHSPKSERHTQKLLQGLVAAGLVMTVPVPRFGRHGRPALAYSLTSQGLTYLLEHGISVKRRFRPSNWAAPLQSFDSGTTGRRYRLR